MTNTDLPLPLKVGNVYWARGGMTATVNSIGPMSKDVRVRYSDGSRRFLTQDGFVDADFSSRYDLVAEWSDEPEQPRTWGEMTDAEKGALLLAYHEGEDIQAAGITTGLWMTIPNPKFQDHIAYRVRPPEPVRETEDFILISDSGRVVGIANLDFVDGELDPDSIRMK